MMFLTIPWGKFIKRFFLIKALGALLTMIAIAFACGVAADLCFRRHPNQIEYMFALMMVCSIVLGNAQYSVARGRSRGTCWIIGMLVMCLVASGIGYFEQGMRLVSLIGMLSAALALACYNSRRYRQMCKRLQVIRRMREEWIAYEKLRR